METGKKAMQKDIPKKKEMRKQLTDKMETALPELKTILGEKKFEHRIKKAARLLMEGLHKEDLPKKPKLSAKKVATTKKAAAKATPAKRAKIAKKAAAKQ